MAQTPQLLSHLPHGIVYGCCRYHQHAGRCVEHVVCTAVYKYTWRDSTSTAFFLLLSDSDVTLYPAHSSSLDRDAFCMKFCII